MTVKYFALLLFVVGLAVAQSVQSSAQPGTEVHGQIQDSQGSPIQQAVVQLRDSGGGLLATGVTDSQGRFNAHVGGPGPYRIQVSEGGMEESADLDASSFGNFVMRFPAAHAASPAPASDTISVNDLEAPKAAKSKLAKAEKALNQRQFSKAWTLANEAVTAAPDWAKAYFVRGVLNLENGDFQAARADLAKSLQQNPHNPAALTELGKLYSTTGAYQLSDSYLRRALQYPPVLWPTYWELAALDVERGQYDEAATMATNAEYATPPAPAGIHLLAGEADSRSGRWGQARQELETYIQTAAKGPADPNAAAWVERARQLLAKIPASEPAPPAATAAH